MIWLRPKLGENYVLLVFLAAVFATAMLAFFSDGDYFFKRKEKDIPAQKVSDENIQKIRKGLLESYENRINSKLARRYPINLELKYSLEGTTTSAPLYDNKTIRSTKIKEELITLFDKHKGRLLIIGEPGAGKTTLLLQLAIQLLERGEDQIPIIINIATWRSRFKKCGRLAHRIVASNGLFQRIDKADTY
jgi:DNA replication protein DnaC